jgi:hypothetical protein
VKGGLTSFIAWSMKDFMRNVISSIGKEQKVLVKGFHCMFELKVIH